MDCPPPASGAKPRPVFSHNAMLGLPAPAKVNLFLHVVGRRPDGYHLLQSAFTFVDLHDEIDLRLRADGQVCRPQGAAGVAPEDDLVVKAARLLKQATGCTGGVDISLRKRIAQGGGLGGGSSDAATVLLGLNRLWALGLPRPELQALGLKLGADLPFFLGGRQALVEGVGEVLTPIAMPRLHLRILAPGVQVPTPLIFQAPELTRNTPTDKIQGFVAVAKAGSAGFAGWLDAQTRNDLQAVAVARYPELGRALAWLALQPGAKLVRMSGSGACCFAAFLQAPGQADEVPEGMQLRDVSTLAEHPLAGLARD